MVAVFKSLNEAGLIGSGVLFDSEQFDFEDKHCVGRNASGAACAVAQMWGDEKPPTVADRHQLQRFGPAVDHPRDGK